MGIYGKIYMYVYTRSFHVSSVYGKIYIYIDFVHTHMHKNTQTDTHTHTADRIAEGMYT